MNNLQRQESAVPANLPPGHPPMTGSGMRAATFGIPGKPRLRRTLDGLASIELTVACLALLLLLVGLCTVEQVRLGTLASVEKYFRSFFLYAPLGRWKVPAFPAGGLVGAVMVANLVAAMALRLRRERKELGLWLIHAGLILLVAGEYVAGGLSAESRMVLAEGETAEFTESSREDELVLLERGGGVEKVHSIRESSLRRGRTIQDPSLPFDLKVIAFYPNARLADRTDWEPTPVPNQGIGPKVSVRPQAPAKGDGETNNKTAYVEVLSGGKSLGVWLVSDGITADQGFESQGRTYLLALRPRREYLPYSITLKDFRHDVYPGTDIPKNFSSLVRLSNPARGEERDVLIYMNHPLRYAGKAFYQASYGKGDTVSILQVVENPGWLLPYFSFAVLALGFVLRFARQAAAFKATAPTDGRSA